MLTVIKHGLYLAEMTTWKMIQDPKLHPTWGMNKINYVHTSCRPLALNQIAEALHPFFQYAFVHLRLIVYLPMLG